MGEGMRAIRAVRAFVLAIGCCLGSAAALSGGPSAAAEERLALQGYDPVAYFTMGRPVQGKPEFTYALDAVRYWFASSKHLELFRADPDRYVPQYKGLCAMGLGAKGYKVEADPHNWLIHEGRLYVTQRDFGPPAFKTDPKRWVASADAHIKALEGLPVGSGLAWW